ncbi:FolP Dihydropteroate synthase and related enzymes [Candidatus Pelagibacterales bacterium]|jgi:dihydropteroate synthase|nr:dihydropteroate synthase [Candidatus Fonsibacter sp.]MCF8523306.1 dihydropteroate synthase [Candidatus Fonsibacter sp.]
MKSIYIRPTNIVFGQKANYFIQAGTAKSLCGLEDVGFLSVEILKRKSDGNTVEEYSVLELERLDFKDKIQSDLNKITSKRNNIFNLNFKNPILMGVLNVTPDSFSDGGKYNTTFRALDHVKNMIDFGAHIIDVGGESTRPGAKSVSDQDEIVRVSETIQSIKKKYPNQLISLDTRKSKVMQHGISIGVDMLNDVSALDFDQLSYQVVKDSGKPIILNHSQGIPENMQNNPTYDNVLLDIFDYFENKIKFLKDNGIKDEQIIIDPGIGFGKTLEHNLEIISKISIFHSLGYPIMVGPSRKSFIGKIMGEKDNPQRLGGTIASVLYSYLQGIQLFRVHDIQETSEALKVYSQFLNK